MGDNPFSKPADDDNPFADPADENPFGESSNMTANPTYSNQPATSEISSGGDAAGGGAGGAWGGGGGAWGSGGGWGAKDEVTVDVPLDDDPPPPPAAAKSGGGGWGAQAAPAAAGAAAAAAGAAAGATLTPLEQKALETRVKELAKKEKELAKKEKDIMKREATIRGKEGDKNWPPCCPVLYHSIEHDIPDHAKAVVTMTYRCWLGLVFAFACNFVAVTIAFFADGQIEAWFLAALYMGFGVPGSFFLWYMRYYVAARKDGAFSYAFFFLVFTAHVCFCLVATVGPPWPTKQALCGVLSMIKAFGEDKFTGVMYLAAAVVWFLETCYSIWVMQTTYARFRGSGSEDRLRAAGAAARAAA